MSELVRLEREQDVGVIVIDNPPVNALSPGVPEGLAAAIETVSADPALKAAVVIGAGRTFIAGADIREFGKIVAGERPRIHLYPMLEAIEDCSKPVVMAIHGTALGGGLEVAMAGHYRVAAPGAQVGQPEVKLGLIPGAGGTQRLPRLAGLTLAAEMCVFGEPVPASKAAGAGIIDRIVEGDLRTEAVAFAREMAAAGKPPKTRERQDKVRSSAADTKALGDLREQAAHRLRGQMAPLAALEAVEAAATLPWQKGIEREASLFEQCLFSNQSKALIHAFFGEREVSKIPGIGKDTSRRQVEAVGVVGAGTMGAGIAMAYANAGFPVLLRDHTGEALSRGVKDIEATYAQAVAKGRLSAGEAAARRSRITPVLTWDGFEHADLVVEAVFENMLLKKQVFAEVDKRAKAGAILASNTSSLDIDEIASATKRPESVVGHHFFSPAPVMRLLEIVRGSKTASDVVATSMDLGKRLKKVCVLAGNGRGFIGNRLFGPYRREAQFLVEEGASPLEVDRALYEWGMAMGPLAVGDLAGLDVGWRIRREFKHLEEPGLRYPRAEDLLCEAGRFGRKTGSGWYQYDSGKAEPDDGAVNLVRKWAEKAGIPQHHPTREEIVERTIFALINEGAKVLEEGIALRAVDIDIVYLNGYGFPAWRGGPMWYADEIGVGKVHERILEFRDRFGAHWEPAPLLSRLAHDHGTFAEHARAEAG